MVIQECTPTYDEQMWMDHLKICGTTMKKEDKDLPDYNCPIFICEEDGHQVCDFWLSGYLYDMSDFIGLFRFLSKAKPSDVCNFHVNSGGGDLTTGYALYQAIKNSKARVIVWLEGRCCSAATFIALSGADLRISPAVEFMVHQAYFADAGKWNNKKEYEAFRDKWYFNVFHDVYDDFLTEDEMAMIHSGKEFWMTCEELGDRLKKMQDMRDEQRRKEEAERAKVDAIQRKYMAMMRQEIESLKLSGEVVIASSDDPDLDKKVANAKKKVIAKAKEKKNESSKR